MKWTASRTATRRGSRFALALFVATLLPSARVGADLRSLVTPGPLAGPHAALDRQCDKCHVPFKGIPKESCLACHDHTAKQIKSGIGPHAEWSAQKCNSCHRDHKGRDFDLVPAIDKKTFSHETTGWKLEGRHRQADCKGCHPAQGSGRGPKWAGVPVSCLGCHGDTHHKGALGDKCQLCHTPFFWTPPRKSAADHKLPMSGGHAGKACVQCHKAGAHLSPKELSCGECHDQKHGGTKAPCATCHNVTGWKAATHTHDFCTCILPGKHQSAPCLSCHPAFKFEPTPLECSGCHKKDLKHEPLGGCALCHSALSWKKKAFDHNKKVFGFPIDGKHLEVGCENCHKTPGVFKGVAKSCEGCHKVPQHGDFGPCAKCHSTAGFNQPRFLHDQTRFPLDGAHLKIACQTCHTRFKQGSFTPSPDACSQCHGDPHKGQFREPAKVQSPTLSGRAPFAKLAPDSPPAVAVTAAPPANRNWQCRDCHTNAAWLPSTVGVQEHAKFRFPLQGRHQGVKCSACHLDNQFVGTKTRCAECHFDAHGGRLGDDCAKCHSENGFADVKNFDHREVTGFALQGAHANPPCVACHGEDRQRLKGVARPITCATCHTPKHGLQFGKDCQSCHAPTKWSRVPPFAHNERTNFPLERRHAGLPCLSCHDARRGERLNPACQTCHGDPHRGATGVECSACHRPDRWLLVRFDHDRSEFPLRGRHFTTPCTQCHKNNQWIALRTDCVVCHARDRVNNPNHDLAASLNCGECHLPFGWHAQKK